MIRHLFPRSKEVISVGSRSDSFEQAIVKLHVARDDENTGDPLARSVPRSGTVCIPTADRGNERVGSEFRGLCLSSPGSVCLPDR